MATKDVSRHVLVRAAAKAGGPGKLAEKLAVSPRVLELYLSGRRLVPDALFLQAVDLLLDETSDSRQGNAAKPSGEIRSKKKYDAGRSK